jgi:ABC-type transport system involved in multi-copper enzyme maturation permease subunit
MFKRRINPLLNKELRIRMRTWRTFALVSLYLLGLGGFALLFFSAQFSAVRMGYNSLSTIGQGLFAFLALFQFVLVVFSVPALVGNAISGERERQTFDLLICTQLTPFGIVLGKLTAALSAVVLLMLASLPLYGFVFLMGGASPGELLNLFLIFLFTALFTGCWSLMFSSLFKRTVSAIIASYALTLLLFGGTLIIALFLSQVFYRTSLTMPVYLLLVLNPLSLFEWLYPEVVGDIVSSLVRTHVMPGRFSLISLLVNIVAGALCLWIATRAVNPLRGKRRG